MKIENLVNSRGNAVKNQFIITEFEADGNVKQMTFQSYDSIVCEVYVGKFGKLGFDAIVTFGRDWDYSRTTMKHLNKFLNDIPMFRGVANADTIRRSIEKGYWVTDEAVAVRYCETLH